MQDAYSDHTTYSCGAFTINSLTPLTTCLLETVIYCSGNALVLMTTVREDICRHCDTRKHITRRCHSGPSPCLNQSYPVVNLTLWNTNTLKTQSSCIIDIKETLSISEKWLSYFRPLCVETIFCLRGTSAVMYTSTNHASEDCMRVGS